MPYSTDIILYIILFVLLSTFFIILYRIYSSVKKVHSLSGYEKREILESLLTPLGYLYEPSQDIISSRNDAWQREFGYHALFDHAAAHLNMVFDYLPVYFDYRNKTWLLEFWKGQYGINTGAEIGLYQADKLISPAARAETHFDAVPDTSLLSMSMTLSKDRTLYASLSKKTWWLTAFSMGRFSKPETLYLDTKISFPDFEMLQSFLHGLSQTELSPACVQVNGPHVHIMFGGQTERKYPFFKRLVRGFAQFMNRIFCKLFLLLTTPFHTTIDRLIYLYYLLPICFRHTLRLRRYKKKWHR